MTAIITARRRPRCQRVRGKSIQEYLSQLSQDEFLWRRHLFVYRPCATCTGYIKLLQQTRLEPPRSYESSSPCFVPPVWGESVISTFTLTSSAQECFTGNVAGMYGTVLRVGQHHLEKSFHDQTLMLEIWFPQSCTQSACYRRVGPWQRQNICMKEVWFSYWWHTTRPCKSIQIWLILLISCIISILIPDEAWSKPCPQERFPSSEP